MSYTASIMTILLAVLLGVMTPGPSFVMVARISVSQSRGKGIAAALGMAAGGTLLSLLTMLGMRTIFAASPRFFLVLQLCGGSYLAYLGIRIWLSAKTPIAAGGAQADGRTGSAFRTAFLVQLSNPNTIMFQSSIFSSVVPGEMPEQIVVVLLTLVFAVHFAWYSLVALLLSANGPRAAYIRAKVWIDRIAGGLILLLGVKLFLAAL